jgi:hypothetical protein
VFVSNRVLVALEILVCVAAFDECNGIKGKCFLAGWMDGWMLDDVMSQGSCPLGRPMARQAADDLARPRAGPCSRRRPHLLYCV